LIKFVFDDLILVIKFVNGDIMNVKD